MKHAQTFWEGFWRGMAAPMMSFEKKARIVKCDYPVVRPPSMSSEEAIRSDWEKIGKDMWAVIRREQEKISQDTASTP